MNTTTIGSWLDVEYYESQTASKMINRTKDIWHHFKVNYAAL
jgi:hypothetical protein